MTINVFKNRPVAVLGAASGIGRVDGGDTAGLITAAP